MPFETIELREHEEHASRTSEVGAYGREVIVAGLSRPDDARERPSALVDTDDVAQAKRPAVRRGVRIEIGRSLSLELACRRPDRRGTRRGELRGRR